MRRCVHCKNSYLIAISVSMFGVSAESMECSYDSKGNSVPTILLLMQERLYSQGRTKGLADAYINGDFSFVDKDEGLLNFFLHIMKEELEHISKRILWLPKMVPLMERDELREIVLQNFDIHVTHME